MLSKRADWSKDVCIHWHVVVFMFHDGREDKDFPYNMDIEDLQAKDWIFA